MTQKAAEGKARRRMTKLSRRQHRRRACTALGALLSATVPSLVARAAPQPPPLPPVDLGQTNIFDGEGAPGVLLEAIAFASLANRLATASGSSSPGSHHQQIASLVLHPVAVAPLSVVGAHPGIEVLVPLAYVHNAFAGPGSGHDLGLGDLTIAPFLEWSKPRPSAGDVSLRAALQVVAPTGARNEDQPVNVGQGAWQVSPYVAATWRASTKLELSARPIFDWTGTAMVRSSAGVAASVRAGDFVVLDASVSYEVATFLRAGLGSYTLWQLRDSSANGLPLEGSREQVFALGPVTRWTLGGFSLLGAAFAEVDARNRPEGLTVNVRLQHPL